MLGITGGIATGKSTLTRALARRLSSEIFDADRTAHELLSTDLTVRAEIEESFGPGIYDSEGRPDRRLLRALVFADDRLRCRLEAILHPAIRARWLALARRRREIGGWLVVDIPLLYETAAEASFDRVVVAACSPGTQRRRLSAERGLDSAMALKIITAQLDLSLKIRRADHVVWTDSTLSRLEDQSELLAASLSHCYG